MTFAREGADIVVCDLVSQIDTVPYQMSHPDDLKETVRLVEEHDQRCLAIPADVRDTEQVNQERPVQRVDTAEDEQRVEAVRGAT